ncbi:hypothetical protein VTJ83DRAFT_6983 [Remersonia thermophila]|uniref:Uncharacterized protein n=1 Tax=Remersonia thermophila TaxID=72144 RepID=A0ABR4D686_9PEZI
MHSHRSGPSHFVSAASLRSLRSYNYENKAVQHLFTPHKYFIQGEATTAKPKFDTQTRATSTCCVHLYSDAIPEPKGQVLQQFSTPWPCFRLLCPYH